MDIQSVTALDPYSLISKNNTNHSSKAATSNFKNILDSAEQKAEKTSPFIRAKQNLQDTYPDLKYHVLDTSQFTYWDRKDFPDSKLFEDTMDVEALKSWRPKTPTATGYEPWVQRDLEKIRKGVHVVFIHPAVQEKMDNDPEYAKQIVDKIEKYFENDVRINKAIDPESIKSMSQAVSITKDGEIGLHVTVCDGPSKTVSDSKEANEKKEKKGQQPLRKLQHSSLPIPSGQITTVSLEYDYRYMYAFIQNVFIQKRK